MDPILTGIVGTIVGLWLSGLEVRLNRMSQELPRRADKKEVQQLIAELQKKADKDEVHKLIDLKQEVIKEVLRELKEDVKEIRNAVCPISRQ